MALREYLAGEVAEDYDDGLITRREALRRLGLFGLGVPAATALLAACGDDDEEETSGSTTEAGGGEAPATTAAGASGGAAGAEAVRFPGPSGEVQGAFAAPADPRASVLVIHENRGLTRHFHDLVGRLAGERYAALAPDLLSPEGGTGALSDPAAAPAALSAAPPERLLGDLRAGIDELLRRHPQKKVGVVGFCFGGAMTWNLLDAGEARLAAAAPFYGPVSQTPDFSRARAAVLAVYGERDSRVNATRQQAEEALRAAGLTYEVRVLPGADHAFFNDTGPRYNERAANEAWAALLAWFNRHLA